MRRHTFRGGRGAALLLALTLTTWGLGAIGAGSAPAQAASNPAQTGSWSDAMPLGIIGVHAALLPTGKVLYYELPGSTLSRARVFDPVTGQSTAVDPDLDWSVFCSGMSFMADGRVFATGGEPPRTHENPTGTGVENDAFFDPLTQTWSGGPPMRNARWYPSNVNMPDGTVLVMGGERAPNGSSNFLVRAMESLNPDTDAWTTLPTSADITGLYPRGILLPNGHVLVPGPERMTKEFDPATYRWTSISSMIYGGRTGGGVVLLPGLQRVLASGGYASDKATTSTAETLDLSAANPQWTSTGSMATARSHQNMVLLPDGTVLAVGGGQNGNFGSPVKTSELYDPTTETWRTMATQAAPRSYHSTALLLPDGRVISAGSNSGTSYELTAEIYSPPYLFKGSRPSIIAAPPIIGFGGTFDVQTLDADGISRVALMRLGATTHGWAAEQRYVDLDFTADSGVLHISGPADAAEAPAGPYMLFVLDGNGVPSVASMMTLGNFAPTLTVARNGSGAGTVSSSPPGIACPGDCEEGFNQGDEVTLTAAADTGSIFTGWSGACAGVGPCDLTIEGDRNVTATFALEQHDLTVDVNGNGNGTVTSDTGGINCPVISCVANDRAHGTHVVLTATPDAGSSVAGWSGGGCTGTVQTCDVTMGGDQTVTATFEVAMDLEVTLAGTGTGTVTSTPHEGIDCPSTCAHAFGENASVTLHAVADTTAIFMGWSSSDAGFDCPSTEDCTVTMDIARSVEATFGSTWELHVLRAGVGGGTVTSDVGGIDCGAMCDRAFEEGTVVSLTPAGGPNSVFESWSGDTAGGCAGSGDCVIAMDQARTIVAHFDPIVQQLSVVTGGTGSGTATSTPAGIDCGGSCEWGFPQGSQVVLHAVADAGSVFIGWNGGGCSGTADCTVTMDAAEAVDARFDLAQHPLTVTRQGNGTGTIASDVGGISCPGVCGASYEHGATLTLEATAAGGSVFAGWGGGACTGTGTCILTMDAARSVTASFDQAVVTTALKESDPAISYNGWRGITDPAASAGAYRMSSVKNDKATWKSPQATSIVFITRTGPDQGKASVTIDGKNKGTLDLYAASPAALSKTYSGLANKAHTVVIKVLGQKNGASGGVSVRLDAFGAGASTAQESDPKIDYDEWKTKTQSLSSDGIYRFAKANTAIVSVTFTGTSIEWITTRGKAYGKASVKIDGISRGTVDLYQPGTAWQSIIGYGGLSPGPHTMVIQVLGQKNGAASSTEVVVDGFIVHG